ncbi:phosphatase PAP2 family protein [Algoriphagus sp.]|uniref:phosphatase PAP2 family protein n=1 Tax=Algoriphagus sp. TaxID=1872435 RepID=UPI0026250214|nr:phosphatase PAP2 family protein [Algoriphagus sp.]
MSLAVMVQMILILIFKHGLFKGMPRPAEYLKGISFYQVPGIELHHWNSFPSGHTATAMVIAAGFMIIFKRNRQIQWLALTAGLVVAFSRVYLMQHFFVDIFAGAALGMISAWIARSLYFRWFPNYKFNRSILVYFGYGKRKEGTVPIKNPGISA